MSDVATVARPYARAAFSFAEEKGKTAEWREFLFLLDLVKKSSPVLSPGNTLSGEFRADYVKKVLDGYIDEFQLNFVKILIEANRLDAISEIFVQYEKLLGDSRGVSEAEVVSARPLSDGDIRRIGERLESRYGRKFNLKNTVDPSVIGGLIIKTDGMVIDASIGGRLERLAGALIS